MAVQARAFWVRRPGVGEIRPVTLAAPGPDEVLVRTLSLGHQPRHRDAGVPRDGAARPVRDDARAVSGRATSRAGQVRLPQCRGGGGGPGRPARAHCLLPLPASDPLRRAGRRRHPRPAEVPRAREPCWPGPSRPRSTPSGTPRRWSATAIAVVGAGMVGCCVAPAARRHPRYRVQARRRRRGAGAGRDGIRHPVRRAGRRAGRLRPGHSRQRHLGRAAARRSRCSPPTARGRTELVRRPTRARCRSVRTFHSGRLTIRASQVGTVSPAQQGRRTHADRLALALRLLRDPAFDVLLTGSSTFDELPDG